MMGLVQMSAILKNGNGKLGSISLKCQNPNPVQDKTLDLLSMALSASKWSGEINKSKNDKNLLQQTLVTKEILE